MIGFEIPSKAGVTLSNLLHIFFDSYSANTKNQYKHVKNKCYHIKAHNFELLSTYNSQHIILTSSQKKLYENRCRSNDQLKDKLKMC